MTVTKIRTAAVYARFSSDLQKDRSIDDQIALCENIAKQHGYRVVKVYSDRAKSAATMFERDELLAMMKDTKTAKFDAVVCESLDRISRDQEDLAGIFKRLRFREIALITSEGVTTDIHVGVRGIVGSMFLTDLGNKVKRGHNGRVREGKIPGAVTYGYRMIPGKPGEREIHPEHSKVVLRVFREYASGKTTREIAASLTRDGIPTPSGGKFWNHQTFTGGRGGKRGMIGNALYVGKLIWNANRSVLDPDKGTKVKRRGKPEDVITVNVPHLRIMPQELWDAANGICTGRAESKFGAGGKRPQRIGYRPYSREHLLAGMLTCGACNGHMRIAQVSRDGGPRVACAAAHQLGTCQHRKSYDMKVLEETVLSGVKAHLTSPQALKEFTKGYHAGWAERQREMRSDRDSTQRALNRANVAIDRVVTAISDSDEPVKALAEKLKRLETERAGLEQKLKLIESDGGTSVVSLHPLTMEKFAASIDGLHGLLTSQNDGSDDAARVRSAFRNIFETIVVHPTAKRMPYQITPYARLSAILGVGLFPTVRTNEEILKEQGFGCTVFGGSDKSVSS
ncbi:recombinase family protein [Bradyrhizobium sp. WYCCWR 13022]|uniref:recombinase family protein n=1 Tax=unclassified Bradyrhizobium TaxID=2631580 RepID=UPI00263A657D|nr:recombinase family protein [Bradyrhizobium sp. WYCCWR 13022]MDN4984647.1 recombinase family protein [Bradyrhizobium sp. WYCCWR 13022]